jgi:hypothetical protein
MTAIVIWLNNENPANPSLWIASDSRVSKHDTTLIDDAVKIFALPIVCRSPGKEGFFSQLSYFHTYGYCFAGNTLLGQNTFLALIPLLSNLATVERYIPQMSDVADFILEYLSRAFDDYKVIAREQAAIEVALFGWCHVTNKQHIFHYHPNRENNVWRLKCEHHTDLKEKSFVYLGDHKPEMRQKIKDAFNGNGEYDQPLSRIPRSVIEEQIQNGTYASIGGDLQLGIADMFGFRPFAICKFRVHGESQADLTYLGYDIHKTVGDAFIGLQGMH